MIVVDTNILIYRWLPSLKGAEADALFHLDSDWAAPLLWRSELRNFLAGEIRSSRMTLSEAEKAVKNAADCLVSGGYFVPDNLVLQLLAQSKCTAYDCEFVALAQMLGVWLVTEDKAILRAFPDRSRSLRSCLEEGLGP